MQKIRILHVIHWPRSGIVTLLQNMLPQFESKLYEQHIVFFEHDVHTMKEFANMADSVVSLNYYSNRIAALYNYQKQIKKICPNILHTHSLLPAFFGCLFASHCPHVVTVHNQYPYFTRNTAKSWVKRLLAKYSFSRKCVHPVAVSYDVQSILSSSFHNINKIVVVENGIVLNPLQNKVATHRSGTWMLISVGRLNSQKSYDVLLRAFKIVVAQVPELHLVLLGDGPEKQKLVSLAKKLGIAENVDFEGWVNNPQQILLKGKFLYVCSSAYEGFGLSVAEAMSLGLPVVSTDVSGVTTLVKDNETGFLVPPGDPKAMAGKIIQVLGNESLLDTVARQGQNYVYQKFDIKNTVKEYSQLYLDITND